MIADTWILGDGDLEGDTTKLVINCVGDLCNKPAIPVMCVFRLKRGRLSVGAKRSDMKEADEALSNIALASDDDPLGETTKIQQVIKSELDLRPAFTAVCDVTGLEGLSSGGAEGVLFYIPIIR